MSRPDLPADPQQWPRNPYQLLAVSPGVSARDLKRAYLDLIRRYKPEFAPAEFRRIREAYEAVSRQAPQVVFPIRPADEQQDGDDTPVRAAPRPKGVMPLDKHVTAQPADDPWDIAVRGDAAGAYRHLRALVDRVPVAAATALQLYWLLVLRPEVDPERRPVDWLILGLRATPGATALVELLRRELVLGPALALDERLVALQADGTPPWVVLPIVEERWKAARAAERWDVIFADINRLRPWLGMTDEVAWCRALVAAARQLVWGDDKALGAARALGREVDQHFHLQSQFADVLAQLDFAHAVADGWRALRKHFGLRWLLGREVFSLWSDMRLGRDLVSTLRRLLPLSWEAPYSEYRALHRAHLEQVARKPERAVLFFERLPVRPSAVVGYLATLLDHRRRAEPTALPALDAADVHEPVMAFLARHRHLQYPALRPALLAFCLRETAPPELLVRVLATAALGHSLAQSIEADRALQYVVACCNAVRE